MTNANGKGTYERAETDSSREALDTERLKSILKRAVNREKAPERLRSKILQMVRK